jgi:uncharacterized integral membrane protein
MSGRAPVGRTPDGSGRRVKVTPALVLWGLVALAGLILLLQNTEQTTVDIFGFSVEMPLFLLLAAAMVIGWLLGTLGWWLFVRRRAGTTKDAPASPPHGTSKRKGRGEGTDG